MGNPILTARTLDLLNGDELDTNKAISFVNKKIIPRLVDRYSRRNEVYELRKLRGKQDFLSISGIMPPRFLFGCMATIAYEAYKVATLSNRHSLPSCHEIEQVCRTLTATAITHGHVFRLNDNDDTVFDVVLVSHRGRFYSLSFINHRTAAKVA